MNKDTLYRMTFNVSWQKHMDTLYVSDERDGSIYPFSGISFDIMSFLIYKNYSLDKTIDQISKKYNADRNIVENDVTEFVKELVEIAILESVD